MDVQWYNWDRNKYTRVQTVDGGTARDVTFNKKDTKETMLNKIEHSPSFKRMHKKYPSSDYAYSLGFEKDDDTDNIEDLITAGEIYSSENYRSRYHKILVKTKPKKRVGISAAAIPNMKAGTTEHTETSAATDIPPEVKTEPPDSPEA